MSQLDWEKLKSNPVLYICFLGLITTAILWYKNENQHKTMINKLENQINEERKERIEADKTKDSLYKILVERETIEKILNKK